ncbi:hypothetical protein ARMSODRAFT_771459 [Armillaria solidipes]|uniref:Uncharacterized protein n=1 Tax=Armillaria solidipes TaxID=1076256 RepID=A0A2H3B7K0_9AGAR|nr:hypothetical protein ARMSODRAFT_771459 [Armillaria solidipes]
MCTFCQRATQHFLHLTPTMDISCPSTSACASFPEYTARQYAGELESPASNQFHLFFNGDIPLSVPCLRALSLYEQSLQVANDESLLSDSSFSPHATAAFNDLHPLTPAQLATFTCLEVKALLSSDPVFVVSKKFSTLDDSKPDPELCRKFLLEDPWIAVRGIYSDFVVCSGCRSIIAGEEDYQRDIEAWISHRDSCAGIEDKILNAIVQSWDALDAMSLMWETARSLSSRTDVKIDPLPQFSEGVRKPSHFEERKRNVTFVREWLAQIES